MGSGSRGRGCSRPLALVAALAVLWGPLVGCGDDDVDAGNNANANANGNLNGNANANDNTNDTPECGDGVQQAPEACDGTDLAGASCQSLGHGGGALVCTGSCTLDESGCTPLLADPAVYRAADDADVCSSAPPAADCEPSDLTFIASEYGSTFTRADDAGGTETVYRLVAYVERLGPSNIDVFVVDPAGAPLPGVTVAYYWPSAPDPSRPDEWYPVQVSAVTGADGRAGFMLTGDAYLDCCGCGGPHAIWVSEPAAAPDTTVPSDLVDHLGMLGGTNHRHLDLLFQRVDPPPAEPPVDAVRCPLGGP